MALVAPLKVQVTFQGRTGTSQDRYVNTWHVNFPGLGYTDADLENVVEAFKDFYDLNTGGALTSVAATIFPSSVAQDGHTIKIYEEAIAPPNLPVWIEDFSLTVDPNTDGLPEEVAVCLSLKGSTVAGSFSGPGAHLPARHLNRKYIGPCRIALVDYDDNVARIPVEVRTILLNAVERLHDDLLADDWQLVIWSPTRGDGEQVISAWVDDAFDIQRRRGVAPLGRTTRTLTP